MEKSVASTSVKDSTQSQNIDKQLCAAVMTDRLTELLQPSNSVKHIINSPHEIHEPCVYLACFRCRNGIRRSKTKLPHERSDIVFDKTENRAAIFLLRASVHHNIDAERECRQSATSTPNGPTFLLRFCAGKTKLPCMLTIRCGSFNGVMEYVYLISQIMACWLIARFPAGGLRRLAHEHSRPQ